jgi:hypothetical protein
MAMAAARAARTILFNCCFLSDAGGGFTPGVLVVPSTRIGRFLTWN